MKECFWKNRTCLCHFFTRFCRTVEVKHVPTITTETNELSSPNQPVKLLVVRQVTLLALIFGFFVSHQTTLH